MKKILQIFITTFVILCSTGAINKACSQVYYRPGNYGFWWSRGRFDSLLIPPIKHPTDTIVNGFVGAIMYSTSDSSLYVSFDGKHYTKVTNTNNYTAGYLIKFTSSTINFDTTVSAVIDGIRNKGGYYSPDTTGATSYIALGNSTNLTSPTNVPFINLGGGKLWYDFSHLQITDYTGASNTGGLKTGDVAVNTLSTYGNEVFTIKFFEQFNASTGSRWGTWSTGQYTPIYQLNTVLLSKNTGDTNTVTTLSVRKGSGQTGNLLQFEDSLGNKQAYIDANGAYHPKQWTTGTRPSSPVEGVQGYNTSLHQNEYWNGTTWVQW